MHINLEDCFIELEFVPVNSLDHTVAETNQTKPLLDDRVLLHSNDEHHMTVLLVL